ncbi:MAG TPA: NUDIX domain-containing protein [Pirellulales bacterium]|nr:NUDIX domain-containing protein [Pirellulales bacterium]
MIESAGLLVYRRLGERLEVLLVHPSGNYNRRAPWSIPKGLPDAGETLAAAAVRETLEETGVDVGQSETAAARVENTSSAQNLAPLGHIDYTRSRKRVHAFAIAAPVNATPRAASWEVDRAEFFPLDEAVRLIHPDQRLFLDRLEKLLAGGEMA